ncbi:MAG: hypothetical protein AABZ74_01760 [Cyanobacteriota bacterium]
MSGVKGVSGIFESKGVADSRTIHFGANESREDRIKRLQEITQGNPNIKLDADAFNKIIKGGNEVDVRLDLEAPDRRNLYIGAFASLAQLAGGLGGAAYNDALGSAVTNRLGGDDAFVKKHGDNYKLGLLGGATAQKGNISVTEGPNASAPPTTAVPEDISVGIAKRNEAQAVNATTQTTKPGNRSTKVDAGTLAKFFEIYGYQQQENASNSTKDGQKGNEIARSILNNQYGKGNVDQGGIKRKGEEGVIAAIYVYGKDKKNGNEVNYLTGDDLKGNGKTKKQNAETVAARKTAAKDYLQLGVTAGLLSQAEVDGLGKDPVKLKNKFKELEGKLNAKYNGNDDTKKTLLDGFLGDHHISTIQKAINDNLEFNQGGAVAINAAANGTQATTDQKRAALQFLANEEGKPLLNKAGKPLTNQEVEDKFKAFAAKIESNDPAALGQARTALASIERAQKDVLFGKGGENGDLKGGLFGTANGAFALQNTILAQNINSTGLFDVSKLKVSDSNRDGSPKTEAQKKVAVDLVTEFSKKEVVNSLSESRKKDGPDGAQQTFTSQIKGLDDFLKDRIDGKKDETTSTQIGGVKLTIGGETTTDTVENQAKKLETAVTGKDAVAFDPETTKKVTDVLYENLVAQLNQANVKKADGGNYTVQDLRALETKGETTSLPQEVQTALKAISGFEKANSQAKQQVSAPDLSGNNSTDIKKVSDFLSKPSNATTDQVRKASGAIDAIKKNVDTEVEDFLKQGGVNPAAISALRTANGGSLANIKVEDLKSAVAGKASITEPQIKKISDNLLAFKTLETNLNAKIATSNSATTGDATKASATGVVPKAQEQVAKTATALQETTGNTGATASTTSTTEPNVSAEQLARASSVLKPEETPTEGPKIEDFFLKTPESKKEDDTPKKDSFLKGFSQFLEQQGSALFNQIASDKFRLVDEIFKRIEKDPSFKALFAYGFTGANAGRITETNKDQGANDSDRSNSAQGQFQSVFGAGQQVGAGLKGLEDYRKNSIERNKDKRVSLSTGIDQFNDKVTKYNKSNPTDVKPTKPDATQTPVFVPTLLEKTKKTQFNDELYKPDTFGKLAANITQFGKSND